MGTTGELIIDNCTWVEQGGTNQNGSVLKIRGAYDANDEIILLGLDLPTTAALGIPSDSIVETIAITLNKRSGTANQTMSLFGLNSPFNEESATYASPNGLSDYTWELKSDESSKAHTHFCSNVSSGTGATGDKVFTVPNNVVTAMGISFGESHHFSVLHDDNNYGSTLATFEDDNNTGGSGNVPTYTITYTQPKPTTPNISISPSGANALIVNKTSPTNTDTGITLNWSTSATINASSTHQAEISNVNFESFDGADLAQVGGNDFLASEDTAYYVRAFMENASFTNATSQGSNTIKISRPKIGTVVYSTAFTNTGDEGVITVPSTNSVHSGRFKKIYVIWDGASSGETYNSSNLVTKTLTATTNSTTIKHIFGSSGNKYIWIGIEDEQGFKSDLKLISALGVSVPNVSARSATAVGQAAKKTMSMTEYGLFDDVNVINSIRSVTGDSGVEIYHHKWKHSLDPANGVFATANATDIDNTELEDGSKKLAVKMSRSNSSTLTIFGIASFYDNNGTETAVEDTHTNFGSETGYYRYVSENIAGEVLYDNDFSGDSPTGTTNYFKHVDMVVVTTGQNTGDPCHFFVGRIDHISGVHRFIAKHLAYIDADYAFGGYKSLAFPGHNDGILDKSNNDIEYTGSGDAYIRRDGMFEVGDKIYVTFSSTTEFNGYYTIKSITGGASDLGNKITFEETISGSGNSAAQNIVITSDTRERAAIPFVLYHAGSPASATVVVTSGVSQDQIGSTTETSNLYINYQKPKSISLDTLIDQGDIALESSNYSRTGGLEGRVPIGKQIYPVGVVRTNSGTPNIDLKIKALTQAGLRILWNIMDGNRYDYMFINTKRLDTITSSHRDLIIKLINGSLNKGASDSKFYNGSFKFMIIGEKRAFT